MTQKCLNNVMLLHAYNQQTDGRNLREIAADFVGCNSRQRNYFGSF